MMFVWFWKCSFTSFVLPTNRSYPEIGKVVPNLYTYVLKVWLKTKKNSECKVVTKQLYMASKV